MTMSIATWTIMSNFQIDDTDKAVEAIKNTKFEYQYDHLEQASKIEDIFEIWSFILNEDEQGNYAISSKGDTPGDEAELFKALAPFVIDNGVIETGMEFGEAPGDIIRVYNFKNGNCEITYLYQDVDEDTLEPTTRRPFNEEEFF
jgi:hypothetical protein